MGGNMSLFDRLVWLHVYQEGGWHSREEIWRDLGMSGRERMRLRHALYRLARDGYLASRAGPAGRPVYGVTARCLLPPGA